MFRLLLFTGLLVISNYLNAQGWGEIQKLTPDDRAIGDEFGWSVVMQGDLVAIGAKSEDGSSSDYGAVYIFEKDATGNWVQTQKFRNSDVRQFDRFGQSIAIDGNYMIIGARSQDFDENGNNFIDSSGAAYIFERDNNGNWNEIQKLVASDRETFQPLLGETVAINGNYAVVNAPLEDKGLAGQEDIDKSGACYIYERDTNGVWNEVQKIVSSFRGVNERWGDTSLAVLGDIIAVGAFRDDTDVLGENEIPSAGAVYLFQRDTNGVWNQIQKIVASGREQGEWFGRSVDLYGNTLVIGAANEYLQGNLSTQYGAVYVFERDVNGVYIETQKIKPDALIHQSKFGHSVDIDGNRMIVGAHFMDIGSVSFGGAAFIFEKDTNGDWNQTAVMYDDAVNSGDDFGYDVAISGGFAIVGAFEQDEDNMELNPLSQAGAAYLFDVNEPNTLSSLATLSIVDKDANSNIRAYPNPIKEMLNLDLGMYYANATIHVSNILGQKIISKTYLNSKSIQLEFYQPKGIYMVKIMTENKIISVLKVVKY
ncbi:T9SS type A sorting domain-containing protein [Hyunsoonleella ulvae]|uniref:T9SS type A sorting domain-containing protein n=1 Tax=Hyunsoonleella ulvae TaxID=2799948 RepID=UPI00193A93E2|nr:T9SS type A sorting domain-containing protein [Hyunsoonleella ulvae]